MTTSSSSTPGISRVHAERIIRQYSLARISPEDYREIAGNVVDNCIEIDGRQVPIVPRKRLRHPRFRPRLPFPAS
ncbi:MAG: hypothetical protein ACLQU1_36840 [Bryobacteraceae bacterium]